MRKNDGITLIAMIVTIIIMLILITVSVQIVLHSGIIGKAKEAGEQTKAKYNEESNMGDNVTINGVDYNSINEYINGLE